MGARGAETSNQISAVFEFEPLNQAINQEFNWSQLIQTYQHSEVG